MSQPLERQIEIRCAPDHAFKTFTEHIDLWWPRSHRRMSEKEAVLILEPWVGGRFYERNPKGEEVEFGKVLESDPPHPLHLAPWSHHRANPGRGEFCALRTRNQSVSHTPRGRR